MVRAQINLPGEGGVFIGLGLAECLVGRLIASRRVGHAGIKPAGVEGVSQIIMGIDIATRPVAGVTIKNVR